MTPISIIGILLGSVSAVILIALIGYRLSYNPYAPLTRHTVGDGVGSLQNGQHIILCIFDIACKLLHFVVNVLISLAGIFNHLYSQMVSVGFRSGNVDVVLKKIADRYEENTNRKLQSIIAVLEPTLVIILSVIVGLILLSVILPLMGIMTSIG